MWTREHERLYGDRTGELEFRRIDDRRSKRLRALDCGHTIPAGLPYRYTVSKTRGIHGLQQTAECDYCMRAGSVY